MLIILSHRIDWLSIAGEFAQYYSPEARLSVPTLTRVGLLMLKSMSDDANETFIPRWVENPYWHTSVESNFSGTIHLVTPVTLYILEKGYTRRSRVYSQSQSGLHGKELWRKGLL